jgi:hypothetical protein
MENCIRCGLAPASGPEDYCPSCERALGRELARGLTQLERYLASFAAFDEWLGSRGGDAGTASFLPRGYSIVSGAFADGSLASLHGCRARLAVAAARHGGRYVAEVVAYASIEAGDPVALRGLSVEVEGEVTAPGVGMTLSLYNWRTRRWNRLRAAVGDGRLLVEPARDFVSPTGDVCLGMRAEHARAFHTRTGLVRFTVET